MVKISKFERIQLEKMGVQIGENGISCAGKKHRKNYMLCERPKNLQNLNKIRNKQKNVNLN